MEATFCSWECDFKAGSCWRDHRIKRVHLLPKSEQIVYNVYEGLGARGCSIPVKQTSESQEYQIVQFRK